MHTNNFYRAFANYIGYNAFGSTMGLVAYNGSTINSFDRFYCDPTLWLPNASSNNGNMYHVLSSFSDNYGGVIFGTGDTPPTLADYKLAGDAIFNLVATVSKVSAMDANGFSFAVTYSLTNNNSEAVTIKEVGSVLGKSAAGQANKVLIDRTVLDNPVTIEAGGVGQVVYTIGMSFPTTA